ADRPRPARRVPYGRAPYVRRGARREAGSGDARTLALRVIRRVTEQGAYSNLALAAELRRSTLTERDRRFATDLVYGTLRATLRLDAMIASASERPVSHVDEETLAVLRLGAYQVSEQRLPAHAAVGETVGLAPPRSRGFVNAVLRRIAGSPPTLPTGDDPRSVSARSGLAEWAVEELGRVLPAGEVEAAAAALATAAGAISLRVNTCRTTADALRHRLWDERRIEAEPGLTAENVLRVARGAPALLPGFEDGWFTVQDEASVLVADALEVLPGERVLDACAGPEGKAGQLSCRAGDEGVLMAADVRGE